MLTTARGGARHRAHGNGEAGLALEPLAEALKGISQPAKGENRSHDTLTLSLSDLAGVLKSAQAGPERGRGPDTKVAHTNGKARPHSASLASSSPNRSAPLASLLRPSPTRDRLTDQPRPKAAQPRQKMTVGASERLRPAHTAETGDKLDINLLTGLIRWVGSAKGRLGARQTATLLDVYRLTGHLTPLVDQAIHGLASLGPAADELAQHAPTTEDLVEVVLSLHGIIYGSGRPPVGPAVDFDPSEMSTW